MEAKIIEQYWRWGSIRELYEVHRVLDRRNCLNFMMMPIDLAILDKTTFM